MKDDRILKPRIRLCPFCGEAGEPSLVVSGAVALVKCGICNAEGPWFYIQDYIADDFHSMTREEQDREWSDATIAAQNDAMKAWNRRPWEGSYFPEELEDLERKAEQPNTTNAHNALKLEGGALYGRSVYEEDRSSCS